jgi:hypothetical protein
LGAAAVAFLHPAAKLVVDSEHEMLHCHLFERLPCFVSILPEHFEPRMAFLTNP